jgi:uncharacterized membrane protein YjjP (DUF1212 family)
LHPARAGFSGRLVAERGAAAREVRDARATGPHSAIDRFEHRNTAPRAAIGAASLGVIFETLDAASLSLIAAIGALIRRWLSGFSNDPLIQPPCAAFVAGIVAAAANRFQLSVATTLVAFCPGMVPVPGPHILIGAIDLARTRIALGIAWPMPP